MKSLTSDLKDDDNCSNNFNGDTLTFTLVSMKRKNYEWAIKNLKHVPIALEENITPQPYIIRMM